MKKSRVVRFLAISLVVLILIGVGSSQNRSVHAWLLGQRGFVNDPDDTRVFFEPSTPIEYVNRIRRVLDACIHRVEERQGRPFPDQVQVFLCAGQDSYNERTAAADSGIARGAVFAGRLYLSPRSFTTETEKQILIHELSHLHFLQILGTGYTTEVPGWFQEGMAVYVSDGGGAEPVSEQQARLAMSRGQHLQPEDDGATFPRMANEHGLQHHMFYRQSELFVRNLAQTNPLAFDRFLADLFEGVEFKAAFQNAFQKTVDEMWLLFLQKTKQDSP